MEFIWLLTRSLCCLWANVKAGKRAWQKKGLCYYENPLCYYNYYYYRFLSNFVESYCCAYLIFTYHHHLYYDKTYLKQAVCWLFNAYAAWLYNILLFWLFRTTTLNWAGTTCLSELSKTICWNCLRTMLIYHYCPRHHAYVEKRTDPNSR